MNRREFLAKMAVTAACAGAAPSILASSAAPAPPPAQWMTPTPLAEAKIAGEMERISRYIMRQVAIYQERLIREMSAKATIQGHHMNKAEWHETA